MTRMKFLNNVFLILNFLIFLYEENILFILNYIQIILAEDVHYFLILI